MKILLINKFYFLQGGAETHFFNVKKLLESKGHQVVVFSMKHPKNFPSTYERFFVSQVDFSRIRYNPIQALRILGRMIYSFEARRKIKTLIKKEKPDIAHIHNIYHHISPSILSVLKKNKIPIVQTLHDYKLVCPNYALFTEQEICERCRGGHYCQAIKHRCLKKSKMASLFAAIEIYIHKKLQIYEKNVDLFISPSKFLKDKVLSWGEDVKIKVIRNFVDPSKVEPNYLRQSYILYIGRLSKEKGLFTLLEAFSKLSYDIELRLAGEGPESEALQDKAHELGISNKVVFCGFLHSKELYQEISNAAFVVLPTLSYENFPFAVLEAFMHGKSVIASRVGGIPELVIEGKTGLLFERHSADELVRAMQKLIQSEEYQDELGKAGRSLVEKFINPEIYYQEIISTYEDVLSQQDL